MIHSKNNKKHSYILSLSQVLGENTPTKNNNVKNNVTLKLNHDVIVIVTFLVGTYVDVIRTELEGDFGLTCKQEEFKRGFYRGRPGF